MKSLLFKPAWIPKYAFLAFTLQRYNLKCKKKMLYRVKINNKTDALKISFFLCRIYKIDI